MLKEDQKIKDQKEVIQILNKLKICPNPQGGLFLFLVVLLILEDYDQEEILELLSTISMKNNLSFLEKEWDFYLAILSFFLNKVKRLEVQKMNILLKNSKDITVFLGEIHENKPLNIKSLLDFLDKNQLTVHEELGKGSLDKMLSPSLEKFIESDSNNLKKLKGKKAKKSKNKGTNAN